MILPEIELPQLLPINPLDSLPENRKSTYIPKNQRKKILLLSDDCRMSSGIGVMSKEIIEGTCHHFNWCQLGAAINHPDANKIADVGQQLAQETGVSDASLTIYGSNGYGDEHVLRQLIQREKPDAIMHFTDPRYWIWLYQMEHELRQKLPIFFYHIWDDTPAPEFNRNYYRSCDWISCISMQTHNIVKQVMKPENVQVIK